MIIGALSRQVGTSVPGFLQLGTYFHLTAFHIRSFAQDPIHSVLILLTIS